MLRARQSLDKIAEGEDPSGWCGACNDALRERVARVTDPAKPQARARKQQRAVEQRAQQQLAA